MHIWNRWATKARLGDDGAVAIEGALTILPLLALLLAVVELGLMTASEISLQQGTARAVRWASIQTPGSVDPRFFLAAAMPFNGNCAPAGTLAYYQSVTDYPNAPMAVPNPTASLVAYRTSCQWSPISPLGSLIAAAAGTIVFRTEGVAVVQAP